VWSIWLDGHINLESLTDCFLSIIFIAYFSVKMKRKGSSLGENMGGKRLY